MDDPFLVGRFQRFRDLAGDLHRLLDLNRACGDPVGERRPFDELEHKTDRGTGAFQSVNRADVRMVQ
jgi:hypothetical protein